MEVFIIQRHINIIFYILLEIVNILGENDCSYKKYRKKVFNYNSNYLTFIFFNLGFIWLNNAGRNVISLINAVTIVMTANIPNSIVGLNSDKVSTKKTS